MATFSEILTNYFYCLYLQLGNPRGMCLGLEGGGGRGKAAGGKQQQLDNALIIFKLTNTFLP